MMTLKDVDDSIHGVIAQSPRDWSTNSYDAWIYGIFAGWGDCLDDIAKQHRWNDKVKGRLRDLHAAYVKAQETWTWRWPLFEGPRQMPDPKGPGAFGAVRKHDIHTGVDLYTYPGMSVLAVEDGVVVAIEDFTGPKAGSPWWNDTQSILIEGRSGVVCYGELSVLSGIQVGSEITREQCLGCVKTVLKKDKGTPRTMLHLELYEKGTTESVWWHLGDPKPSNLLDPTELVGEALMFMWKDQ
jgi:murein DD-endopeptidase MepM/ murein hydrolase activator NlpD